MVFSSRQAARSPVWAATVLPTGYRATPHRRAEQATWPTVAASKTVKWSSSDETFCNCFRFFAPCVICCPGFRHSLALLRSYLHGRTTSRCLNKTLLKEVRTKLRCAYFVCVTSKSLNLSVSVEGREKGSVLRYHLVGFDPTSPGGTSLSLKRIN